ncbi:unnamed protein product [Leptosia nina]|uniref:Uncharacterized protein n=1 Tax=Leptosia nina TaxID=320188 RepID=A0AAV1K1M1_9NEOP
MDVASHRVRSITYPPLRTESPLSYTVRSFRHLALRLRDKVYIRTCTDKKCVFSDSRQRIIAAKIGALERLFACPHRGTRNCEIHASRCGTKIRLWIPLSSSVIVIRGSVHRYVCGLYDFYSWRNKPQLIEYCSGYLRKTSRLSDEAKTRFMFIVS